MKEYIEKDSLGRFLGFWRVLICAGFACGGPDVVMMTSAEVQNPRVVIPRATKKIYFHLDYSILRELWPWESSALLTTPLSSHQSLLAPVDRQLHHGSLAYDLTESTDLQIWSTPLC